MNSGIIPFMVYRHIRPDRNEPFYIGIGKEGSGRESDKRRNSMWESIVKANNGNYEKEILLSGLTLEEASDKEIEFIKLYGRICNRTGTLANIQDGGVWNKFYHIPTEEEKKLLSDWWKVNNFAEKCSTEKTPAQREAISIRMKGHKPFNYPGTMTPEGKARHIARITGNHYAKDSGVHIGNTYSVGRMHITNGINNQFIMNSDPIPEGWRKGRTLHYKDPTRKGRPKKQTQSVIHK